MTGTRMRGIAIRDGLLKRVFQHGLRDGMSEEWQCQRFDAFLKKLRQRWGERLTVIVDVGTSCVRAHRIGYSHPFGKAE